MVVTRLGASKATGGFFGGGDAKLRECEEEVRINEERNTRLSAEERSDEAQRILRLLCRSSLMFMRHGQPHEQLPLCDSSPPSPPSPPSQELPYATSLLLTPSQIRKGAKSRGLEASVLRVGTLKGGGPGDSGLGLDKFFYDTQVQVRECARTTPPA